MKSLILPLLLGIIATAAADDHILIWGVDESTIEVKELGTMSPDTDPVGSDADGIGSIRLLAPADFQPNFAFGALTPLPDVEFTARRRSGNGGGGWTARTAGHEPARPLINFSPSLSFGKISLPRKIRIGDSSVTNFSSTMYSPGYRPHHHYRPGPFRRPPARNPVLIRGIGSPVRPPSK